MTRKDYVLIAAALRAARSSYTFADGGSRNAANVALYNNGVDNAAALLANELQRDNQRFDRERFFRAAGVQS